MPVATFVRFGDDVLEFGSDDILELYIKAAYEPPYCEKPFKQSLSDSMRESLAAGLGDDD